VEGLGNCWVGHLVVTAAGFDGGACLENQAACFTDLDRGHRVGVGCFGSHSIDPPPAAAGRGCAVSELDFLQRGSVVQEVSDVGVFLITDKAVQDLQHLIAIAGTIQQGGSDVERKGGHRFRG
jgi:hypothetical protein